MQDSQFCFGCGVRLLYSNRVIIYSYSIALLVRERERGKRVLLFSEYSVVECTSALHGIICSEERLKVESENWGRRYQLSHLYSTRSLFARIRRLTPSQACPLGYSPLPLLSFNDVIWMGSLIKRVTANGRSHSIWGGVSLVSSLLFFFQTYRLCSSFLSFLSLLLLLQMLCIRGRSASRETRAEERRARPHSHSPPVMSLLSRRSVKSNQLTRLPSKPGEAPCLDGTSCPNSPAIKKASQSITYSTPFCLFLLALSNAVHPLYSFFVF